MHTSTVDPLLTTVILLTAGVVGLALARYARISPIIGFFVLGTIIGPQALGLVESGTGTIHFLGELGVSFLLFDVGLHLSVKELRKTWKLFFLSGTLQFLFVTTGLALLGRVIGLDWCASLLLGAIFSLSSTALVMKILSDDQEETSPVGKRATEILVFQDLIAILLLVIVTGDLSQGIAPTTILISLGKMAVAATAVVLIGRIALKPLFTILISIKSDEVITAFALLLVFVASYATQSLGLSLALGAFLGGLALSESSYSYLVRGELAPFRSLLLSLFFLSVGIGLDLVSMASHIWMLLALLVSFMAAKTLLNFLAFRASGIERGQATYLSFVLAQGSEFGFVLLPALLTSGALSNDGLVQSVSIVGLSLAVTPLMASLGCRSSRSVCQIADEADAENQDPTEVIIVRIDETGRRIANFLNAEQIPYRAHDNDLERLAYAKSRGFNVYFSDLNRPRTLGRATLGKVLAIVCLLEDDYIARSLIEGLHKINGSLPIVAATESPARLELLSSLGVEQVYIKNDSGSVVALFEGLLKLIGFEPEKIESAVNRALRSLDPEQLFPQINELEPASAAMQ